jgi:hypothetical protein
VDQPGCRKPLSGEQAGAAMTILPYEPSDVLPGGEPAAISTHVPCPPKHVATGYQKARINVFVNSAQRHQLDALAAEWCVPVTEALRRVLAKGLQDVMHTDSPNNGETPIGSGGSADDC